MVAKNLNHQSTLCQINELEDTGTNLLKVTPTDQKQFAYICK